MQSPLFGPSNGDLTGIESRAVRAALCLERRHVAAITMALGLWNKVDVTTATVTIWERSKGRGYPNSVVDALRYLDDQVDFCARTLVSECLAEFDDKPDRGSVTLRRPLGAHRIHQMMGLSPTGKLAMTPPAVRELDAAASDIWQCLADAAIYRAAQTLKRDYEMTTVRIEFDREPDRETTDA